jgi:hypothetical protein
MRDARSTLAISTFVLAATLAATAPLTTGARGTRHDAAAGFPGWPADYEGKSLTPLPMTDKEQALARDFPGRIARFSDGRREIVVRYVAAATRKLHPAADCFRGIGYAVSPMPARRDASGQPMSCTGASKGSDRLTVCEVIRGSGGRSWPDVSSWYWSALFDGACAQWWSYVVAERG